MTYLRPGMTVGLLGGSFDPPHLGHVHITKEALKRFDLDHILWLVSPGNPLKSKGPAAISRRMKAAQDLMDHPRVTVSDFEARAGTRYTAETIQKLIQAYPGVNFVWLMGADNLAQFHKWKDWRKIMDLTPVGVLARPGDRIAARAGKAADVYRDFRIKGRHSRLLGSAQAPAWSFVNVPMVNLSSTQLRENGGWVGD
ncbi:nicotinate-nucleotide adenylyltransferase [Cognatishimia sp. WU-CL00825]|uniref:nicotinate-nucleotide adenylyltransferase n=1 Tax=Cognatishimia sp. WU-CL00825 TaxID=3127658 RepID=UPI003103FCCD